jgi:2-oxoglutarate dehydrogenase E2 component (dihydrolipoamide succinyltransferase)
MSNEVEITLPKLGESIVNATVVRWFKKEGDPVALDEPLLEVSTDKVNSEIPSPMAGVLKKILVQVDVEVNVGAPLAVLSTEEEAKPSSEQTLPSEHPKEETGSEDLLSPAVMKLLREKKIPMDQIDKIPRTGHGGRLTKRDVENYAADKTCPLAAGTERVKMTSLRKAIAENMVKSFYEAPHASLMTEVDVTEIVKTIQREKQSFLEKHGAKLSITAFVAKAITKALKEFPLLNSSLEGETILVKKFINLGLAVSVDHGVMVPVIQSCDQLDLPGISRKITLTNFGMTGTMIGVPIIRHPEVAIIGMGAITKKAVPREDDSIAVRSMMWISLTFDHRVLDGLYGCGFLGALKKALETDNSSIS